MKPQNHQEGPQMLLHSSSAQDCHQKLACLSKIFFKTLHKEFSGFIPSQSETTCPVNQKADFAILYTIIPTVRTNANTAILESNLQLQKTSD